MIKVIGIDPGLASTGIGVVKGKGSRIDNYSFGSIQTSKNISLPNRLDQIFSKITRLLKEEKPDLMVVEDSFSLKKNPKPGLILGKVAGVVLLAGCRANVPVVEVTVREAKKVLTGNGNASKGQLEKVVRNILKKETPISPDHASDAIGLAIIGIYRYGNNTFDLKQG
jgi:crossover junction endodeoxyribonuclease RuvC